MRTGAVFQKADAGLESTDGRPNFEMNYEGGKAMPRRIHSVLVILVFAVILGFAFAGRVAAQSRAAEITGTVTDSSGAVVPGARVSLTNVATGARTDLTTTAAGLYYARLNPGTYRIV